MVEITRILCPLDESEASRAALAYATMLSRWYGAALTAIEMIWVGVPPAPPGSPRPILGDAQLDDLAGELRRFVDAQLPSGSRADVIVRQGPVVQGIIDEARQWRADSIVMGTHGRRGFQRFILGSVTEDVLRHAPCPVFTVPPASVAAPVAARPFTTILCPIDFSPASERALRFALSLAEESGKRLLLLHVIDAADGPVPAGTGPVMSAARRRLEDDTRRELRAIVPDDARLWCECLDRVTFGRPDEEILRVAEADRADLIVMGVHSRHAVELAFFGSTAGHVVRRATCPVLTMRPA